MTTSMPVWGPEGPARTGGAARPLLIAGVAAAVLLVALGGFLVLRDDSSRLDAAEGVRSTDPSSQPNGSAVGDDLDGVIDGERGGRAADATDEAGDPATGSLGGSTGVEGSGADAGATGSTGGTAESGRGSDDTSGDPAAGGAADSSSGGGSNSVGDTAGSGPGPGAESVVAGIEVTACDQLAGELQRIIRSEQSLSAINATMEVAEVRCSSSWASGIVTSLVTPEALGVFERRGDRWSLVAYSHQAPCSALGLTRELAGALRCGDF